MMMSASIRLDQQKRGVLSNRKLTWGSLSLLAMALWNARRVTRLSMGLTTTAYLQTAVEEGRALHVQEQSTNDRTKPLVSIMKKGDMANAINTNPIKIEQSAHPGRSIKANSNSEPPVIDFISVGSLIKPEYQQAQLQTFGRHDSVRNFFRVNELNDTDATCHKDFTMAQWHQMRTFCNSTEGQSEVASLLRTRLFWPNKHTGWMCAQKRPIDGLRLALEQYQTTNQSLPDYLFIIDDDTYVNMPAVTQMCKEHYPITEPHVVAGCRFTWPRKLMFSFPMGGFGSIITRAALERIVRPLYCDSSKEKYDQDEFSKLACWRLEQDHVGEKRFFHEGMSVGELMIQYAAELPFTRVHEWNHTGYCFHSDHTLGYFFDFYHIMLPEGSLGGKPPSDRLRRQSGYEFIVGGQECKHEKQKCPKDARMCHYIKPQQMKELHSGEKTGSKEAHKISPKQ